MRLKVVESRSEILGDIRRRKWLHVIPSVDAEVFQFVVVVVDLSDVQIAANGAVSSSVVRRVFSLGCKVCLNIMERRVKQGRDRPIDERCRGDV